MLDRCQKPHFNKKSFGKIQRVYSPKHQSFLAAKTINVNLNETKNKKQKLAMISRVLYAWDTITKNKCQYNNRLVDFEDTIDGDFVFYSKFHEKGPLSSSNCKNIFIIDQVRILRDIAKGIKECHDNNLCHANVKPKNVLITNSNKYIVTNYKNTVVCEEETCGLSNIRGTLYYMAPDVLLKEYGKNIDVWSLGIIAYTLFTYGEHPIFKSQNANEKLPYNQAIDMLLHGDIHMPESVPTRLITDFLRKTLSRDKQRRLTIHEVLQHPLLKL